MAVIWRTWPALMRGVRASPNADSGYGMQIDNRQRRIQRADGSHYIVSEYMFVVPEAVSAKTLVSEEVTTEATSVNVAPGWLF